MKQFILRHWLEVAFASICGIIMTFYKKLSNRVKQKIKEQQLLKDGVLAILHDRLYQSCRLHIKQGCINVEALRNVEYLHKSYHNLGGNGTGTELYNRVKALPIKEMEDQEL